MTPAVQEALDGLLEALKQDETNLAKIAISDFGTGNVTAGILPEAARAAITALCLAAKKF